MCVETPAAFPSEESMPAKMLGFTKPRLSFGCEEEVKCAPGASESTWRLSCVSRDTDQEKTLKYRQEIVVRCGQYVYFRFKTLG